MTTHGTRSKPLSGHNRRLGSNSRRQSLASRSGAMDRPHGQSVARLADGIRSMAYRVHALLPVAKKGCPAASRACDGGRNGNRTHPDRFDHRESTSASGRRKKKRYAADRGLSQFVSRESTKLDRLEPSSAKINVSGGRGLSNGENYTKVLEPPDGKMKQHWVRHAQPSKRASYRTNSRPSTGSICARQMRLSRRSRPCAAGRLVRATACRDQPSSVWH